MNRIIYLHYCSHGRCTVVRGVVLFVSLIAGCSRTEPHNATSPAATTGEALAVAPLSINATQSPANSPLFRQVDASAAGIDFQHEWNPRDTYEAVLLKTGFAGGGVCLGDFDNDGKCDVYLTRPHGGGRLYRNQGPFSFLDVTKQMKLDDPSSWTTGASFVDVNNDGWLDLYVCCFDRPNRLYLNLAGKEFQESPDVGLSFRGASIKTVFADYDNDGDLDAYLVTNRLEPRDAPKIRYLGKEGSYRVAPEHQELVGVINLPDGTQKFAKAGQFDHLFRNQLQETGTLQFSDVSQQAGITGTFHGLDATWWDADGDRDADLYVANDFTDPDHFYRNNGDGTFTDILGEAVPNTPWFCMGSAAGDLNNDGRLDLFVTDMAGTTHFREKIAMGSMDSAAWFLDTAEPRQFMRNALFVNTGTDRFMELAHLAGLAKSDWTWSAKMADLDNDGWLDIFVTNGFTRDYLDSDFNESLRKQGREADSRAWEAAPELKERNLAFRNLGDMRFENVAQTWGLDALSISFGAAAGDLDNDGDLDLIVNDFSTGPLLYENQSTQNKQLVVSLEGTRDNRFGVGAVVEVTTASGKQVRYLGSGSGYMSADAPYCHFGLATADHASQLRVMWPNGEVQDFNQVPANHHVTVKQASIGSAPVVASKVPNRQSTENGVVPFRLVEQANEIRHRETKYDDFQAQPLLPNKLSQWGPGMAWGDIDQDGDLDFYLAGAAGYPGQFVVCNDDGEYQVSMSADTIALLDEDKLIEQMGCLLFDIDGDDDLDLYVVSGGVECKADDERLQDRLYVNMGLDADGLNRWQTAPADQLPEDRQSGGTVTATDFDRDGDLDLFVGGRVVPGQYPLSPASRLLVNENGKLVDRTSDIAPELARCGMVTSALWSDIHADGWIDLLITTEYGPVRVLKNEQGKLSEISDAAGTAKLLGWWTGIAGCDVDADGDTDYAVTNFGRNTKYHPSVEHPQVVFYGDFDHSGRTQIVEAKPGDQGLIPVRGRSCSSSAMPFLRDKFPTYRAFATATLSDIYTEQCLNDALRLDANTLDSGLLVNDGQGRFEFRPFPWLAQASPAFGAAFVHANRDAHIDLVLTHNFATPQRETGRMMGGVGLLLTGRGDGALEPVWPSDSGILLPDDSRGIFPVDWNKDGWDDLAVATNNGPVRWMEHTTQPARIAGVLAVKLEGSVGNRSSVGARVTARLRSGRLVADEVRSGEGYLTQGPRVIRFAHSERDPMVEIAVDWPTGERSTQAVSNEGLARGEIGLTHPGGGK